MSHEPAQKLFVLQALKDAGARGVHTFELRRSFIGNPSQRITELEALGYVINKSRERLNGKALGARYTLISGPDVAVDRRPEPPSRPVPAVDLGTGTLMSVQPEALCALFDYDEAIA